MSGARTPLQFQKQNRPEPKQAPRKIDSKKIHMDCNSRTKTGRKKNDPQSKMCHQKSLDKPSKAGYQVVTEAGNQVVTSTGN